MMMQKCIAAKKSWKMHLQHSGSRAESPPAYSEVMVAKSDSVTAMTALSTVKTSPKWSFNGPAFRIHGQRELALAT